MNSNIIEKYIRETYYYIIKVEIVSGRYSGEVYYKIGEGTSKRPEELKKKYSKFRNINVEILDKKLLPQNTTVGKRLNDKVIHRNILSKMNRVDSRIIENLLYTSDGSNEFFETTTLHNDIEVVNYIDEVVNELAKDINNFTAKINYNKNYYLHYNNTQSHVVSCKNSDKMFEHANVTDMSQLLNKTVLLVGQYVPDMIASIAFICKEIIIWHDAEEQKHQYEYDKLNKNLCGIREMKKLPQAVIIVDSTKEYNAIREANILNIPVFGIIDTNCDPDNVDYVIPGNDDAVRSIKVILGVLNNAIIEAKGGTLVDYLTDEDKKGNKKESIKEEKKVEIKKEEIKEEKPVKEVAKKEPKLDLNILTVSELRELAKKKEIKGYSKLKKEELIEVLK